MSEREPLEVLRELGIYNPDAPGAEEQAALVRLALDRGASLDEIAQGIAEHRLHAVAAERLLVAGTERITFEEAVRRAGIAPEFAARVWRALGLVTPEPGAAVCTEADVGVFEFFMVSAGVFGEDRALSLARTTGATTARLADAGIASVRAAVEAPLRSGGASTVDIAQGFVEVAEAVVWRLYPMLETVHRRHMLEAGRRYTLWGAAPTEESTTDAVVGFADVVGSTALGQRLSAAELDTLVTTFEERALAAVSRPGARLVKLIGDEVMFVAGTMTDALDIARRLVGDPELPPLRVGLAAGEVVTREGDVYGPVVNLAARLVAIAEPGGILLDAEAARRLGPGVASTRGTRDLAGFAGPVEVFEPIDVATGS